MVVLEQARERPAGATEVVLTTNPGNGAVSAETVGDIVAAWQAQGGMAHAYEWPAEMGLTHNMINDVSNADKFDEVYPILIRLFTTGAA
jgi:hypothetical protein